MIFHAAYLLILDGLRLFSLISEALKDRVELNGILLYQSFAVWVPFRHLSTKGSFSPFALLVGMKRVVPVVDFFLPRSY